MRVKKQSGQILVLFMLSLVVLIAMVGVVVDGGRAYSDLRSLESAAEAGAHAGAFLMEKSWSGESGTYGSLTDGQVKASALAFAQYNGWNAASGDVFYMDYVKPDRTTHVAILDNTVRGVMVQLSKPETATFTRVLGFKIFPVFARATAMFGVALTAGAIPLALNDDCMVGYDSSISMQPANGSGSFGTCNFGSVVPPGCVAGDITCYQNAMANGMNPPVKLGPPYPINGFDFSSLAPETAAALKSRIDQRPGETCTSFKSPSPRVVWMPVVPGGFGGSTLVFVRYRAFFLTSIAPGQGFTGCFVHATINGGDFDPNAVGTAYGGVMIMKLIRSSGAVVPVSINITTLTSPAARGAVNGASLAIHTNQPGANCSILVYDLPPLPGKPSTAGGLGPQIANGTGDATWTWTVEPTALVGPAQVQIQCSYHGMLGYAFTNIVIA
ncbi:MAG TPA: pilus assembly protein TadG-related protein [Candidatus Nitrosotalea sp.]|nr:pilus assembly protein TadG-related protein [Candidatus Nitrosotalea sp.]